MKVKLTIDFQFDLIDLVSYIAKHKSLTARKFKNDLIRNLKKDLKNLYNFKKSIYFDEDFYRDYVFKGHATICKVDLETEIVYVLGVLRHKNQL